MDAKGFVVQRMTPAAFTASDEGLQFTACKPRLTCGKGLDLDAICLRQTSLFGTLPLSGLRLRRPSPGRD